MFSMEFCLSPGGEGGGRDMRERERERETEKISLLSGLVIDYEGCG